MFDINPIGFGETVEHLKYVKAGVDENGFKVPGRYVSTMISGVGVDASAGTNAIAERKDGTVQRADVDLVLFLPPGFTCDSKDRFKVRGNEYEAVSVGEKQPNFFTGAMFRTEVAVKRSNG